MAPKSPVLDHIVILLPYSTLTSLPTWLTRALTILPGGTHADGLTENKLIIFADGTYIELIAFLPSCDPAKRARHRWGRKTEGTIVDWACTLFAYQGRRNTERFRRNIASRVNSSDAGIQYPDLVAGGRTTPDGTELKWAISAPEVSQAGFYDKLRLEAGELPFWCLDETKRELRVPCDPAQNVEHACGAVGVAGVAISCPEGDKVSRLRTVYGVITDQASGKGDEGEQVCKWEIDSPLGRGVIKPAIMLQGSDEVGVTIKLALYTKETAGHLEGDVGDGQTLVLGLVPLEKEDSWDWL